MRISIFDSGLRVNMALAKTTSPRGAERNGGRNGGDQVIAARLKPVTDFDEDSEYADLAEKVFQDLSAALDRDEQIDEFDIVPVESEANHSPVLYAGAEHKLGLESWCIPYLYTHSYKMFLAIRRKQKNSSTLGAQLTPSSYGGRRASDMSELDRISKGLLYSRVLVLLNPDVCAAWNCRRDWVLMESLDVLERELRLINLVASRKPKCPEGFAYRRWLITRALKKRLITEDLLGWIANEIGWVESPCERYFGNYHAWSYRLWLVQGILKDDNRLTPEEVRQVLESEVQRSNSWKNTHVSDYCGYHYRQKLLEFCIQFGCKSVRCLGDELDDNAKQIALYEGHETLWQHRRMILKLLANSSPNTAGEYYNSLQAKEKQFIDSIVATPSSTSQGSQTLLNVSNCQQHLKWIRSQLPALSEFFKDS